MFPWLLLSVWVGGQALLGSRSDCSLGMSAEATVKQPCKKSLKKVVKYPFSVGLNMQQDEPLGNVCLWRTAAWAVSFDAFTGSEREPASNDFVFWKLRAMFSPV